MEQRTFPEIREEEARLNQTAITLLEMEIEKLEAARKEKKAELRRRLKRQTELNGSKPKESETAAVA